MPHWPQFSLRTMLLLMAAAVPLVWIAALFTRVDKQYVDPVTGALKRTTSYWGVQTRVTIEPTALGTWLEARGQGQPPKWQFSGSQSMGCFNCGYVPPVYNLRSAMPLVLKLLDEDELLALVQVLRTGTEAEQKSAVEAIEKRLFP